MWNFKLNIGAFLLAIYILTFVNLAQINSEEAIKLAARENRASKTMPGLTIKSFFSGNFFRDFDEYFADTFAFRDNFIKVSKKLKQYRGIKGEDVVEIVAIGGVNVADKLGVPQTNNPDRIIVPANNLEAAINEKDGDDEEILPNNKFGQILIINDSAMEIHAFNEVASTNYANSLNYIQEQLPDKVKVYSMFIPTQIEFVKNQKHQDLSYSQIENIQYINSKFNDKVIPINAYDVLQDHAGEYIYFRTDHHWTALGAYYAYTELMRTKNEEAVPLADYELVELSGFLGSLYAATLSEKLKSNPDLIQIFVPFGKHQFWIYYDYTRPVEKGIAVNLNNIAAENMYGVFLGGDFPLGKIVTENKNGQKIVVIKDSYANAFIPFLIPHYEEIYIIDPRMYEENLINFVQANGIQEVLFLNYVLVNRYDGYAKLFMAIGTK